jgi:hypothetical protein
LQELRRRPRRARVPRARAQLAPRRAGAMMGEEEEAPAHGGGGGAAGGDDVDADALALAAAEPAVDMSKHLSGIIPILQCAPRPRAACCLLRRARGAQRCVVLCVRARVCDAQTGTWWPR